MKYVFEHFLVNGEIVQAPNAEVSLEVNNNANLKAVYQVEVQTVTITYTSEPIPVDAVVNGLPLASGSSLGLDMGSIVNVSVQNRVVYQTDTYVFDYFLVNGAMYGGPRISLQVMVDLDLRAVYRLEDAPPEGPGITLGEVVRLVGPIVVGAVLVQAG